ncbi:hypothetical protein BGX29_011726 [Mortierella sp. GBA35]|nr:hypothetical protein BGX29_011726 [Mortierella sp. GBA35]
MQDHPPSQPSKILFMSEIVDVVGIHLSPPDLLRCILVCRAWNRLFIPHLYEILDDTLYAWPKTIRRRNDPGWFLDTFIKYGHLVRHLRTSWTVINKAASAARTCTRLRSLVVPQFESEYSSMEDKHPILSNPPKSSVPTLLPPYAHDRQRMSCQWLWLLIQQNSQTLQELSLYRVGYFSIYYNLVEILASCPHLSRLVIGWAPERLQTLLERSPQLQHFQCDFGGFDRVSFLMDSPASQLVTLRIAGGISRVSFFSLLRNLPSLEQFWIGSRYMDHASGSTPTDFRFAQSRLKGLHFTRRDTEENLLLMVSDILPWVPDLTDISLPCLSTELAESIVAHCSQLQAFRQSIVEESIYRGQGRNGAVNSAGILLANCPHLTVFDGPHYEIEVQDMLASLWICQGLEELRFQIIGVSRLSEEEEMDYRQGRLFQRLGWPLSEAETRAVERYESEIRQQHQQIYGQLSKLVHLKVLELGMEHRDVYSKYYQLRWFRRGAQTYADYGEPFPDTLELSLASGLGQLSTLKRLEVFGFESVDHRIDEEELWWMAETWPRLRVMRGLQEVKLPFLMHDGEKWYRRVFMQRLRPLVKHQKHPL